MKQNLGTGKSLYSTHSQSLPSAGIATGSLICPTCLIL